MVSAAAWYRATVRGYSTKVEPSPQHWDMSYQVLAPAEGGNAEATECTLAIEGHGDAHLVVPLQPVAPCAEEPSTPAPVTPATGARADVDPLASMNLWGQFVPSTAQPTVVFAADVRVVEVQEEVDHRVRTLAQSLDCFGGKQLQESKLAEARQRLHELQPRKPVALSTSGLLEAGNVGLPPPQETTAPAAASASATGPAEEEDSARPLSAAAEREWLL